MENNKADVEEGIAEDSIAEAAIAEDAIAEDTATICRCALLILDVLATLITICSSFGFSSQSQWTFELLASLGIALWGLFLLASIPVLVATAWDSLRVLAWTRNLAIVSLILSIVTAFVCALGALSSCGPLWLFYFYHYVGLTGALVSLSVFYALPFLFPKSTGNRHTRPIRRWVASSVVSCSIFLPWGVFWLVAWAMTRTTGVDFSQYPDAASSPYKLPYPNGETSAVIQGNGGSFSHNDPYNMYGYDFRRACGTPIIASRGGTVVRTEDSYAKNIFTGQDRNNRIHVEHDDGTVGVYLHLEQSSLQVGVGDLVVQGQWIANSGNVGFSTMPHIHFQVVKTQFGGESIPVSFRDVVTDLGVPRALRRYTSGNELIN